MCQPVADFSMKPNVTACRRRGKQLQAAVEGVSRRRPTLYRRQGDLDLLAILEDPYSDVEETEERLRELQAAFEERGDRRAVFLSIYSRMTRAVAEHVRDDGFENVDWVSDYLVAFANLYREAVYDYEAGNLDSLADPWQLAFEAAERGDVLVIQDAALGVNAHINYDLALALERIDVVPNPDRKYTDHCTVTDVIREIIDEAQDSLAERGATGIEKLDEALGSMDDLFWVFTIDECRDSAWRTAVALHSSFPPRRRLARWINDVTATGAAHLILCSQASDYVHDGLLELEGSSSLSM